MKPFICINYTDAGLKNAKTSDLVASITAYAQSGIILSNEDKKAIQKLQQEVEARNWYSGSNAALLA